jgi:hypothetical protein
MNDLIERLAKTTGQDRDLDARITYAVKPALQRVGPLDEWLKTSAARNCHTYTWSIDDALTLLPDGARLRELGQWDDNGQPGGWYCDINQYWQTGSGWEVRSFSYGIPDPMDYHPKVPPLAFNGAIAVSIAALKARLAATNLADRAVA